MKVAIGLPNAVPGVTGAAITGWARAAEQAGFSMLGSIDRIVYPNMDPLIALGAAAAVTERIELATTVLNSPYRTNTALLAKQIATLDSLSDGRFVLGIGIGAREDDYTASGLTTKGRGRKLTEQLLEMKQIWDGEERGTAGPIGPPVTGGKHPKIWVGGGADIAFERAAKYGDGWIFAGGPAEVYEQMAAKADRAWEAEGRQGKCEKAALAYFSLGDSARDTADAFVHDYYGWLGKEIAGFMASSVAVDTEMVRAQVSAFEQAGCDELIFCPSSHDAAQVGLLASAALGDTTHHPGFELARGYGDAMDAGDLDALGRLAHPDITMWAPSGWPEAGPFVGRDAFLDQCRRLIEDFDVRETEPIEARHVGDWVVAKFNWHTQGIGSGATTTKAFNGAYRIEDGLLIEVHWMGSLEEALAVANNEGEL